MFRGCPLLESVKLSLAKMSSAALRALFEYCTNMTKLHLHITTPEESSLIYEPILYTHYPSLTKLTVLADGVTDRALRDIFTYCTNLREVHIGFSNPITDETIMILLEYCSRLTTLRLDD